MDLTEPEYAALLTLTLVVGEVILHEVTHLLINILATGTIRFCDSGLGPFALRSGRLYTCLAPGGLGALNNLLTPLALAVAGLVGFWYAPRICRPAVRWALAVVGVYTWATESLYAMGWLVPPVWTAGGVRHVGDGAIALEAFGWGSQVPGSVVLLTGIWILFRRLQLSDDY